MLPSGNDSRDGNVMLSEGSGEGVNENCRLNSPATVRAFTQIPRAPSSEREGGIFEEGKEEGQKSKKKMVVT